MHCMENLAINKQEKQTDDNNLKILKECKNLKGKSLWPIIHQGFSLLLLFTSVCD